MTTISQLKLFFKNKLDFLDLDLIIADAIKKPREFVLAHPETPVNRKQESVIRKNAKRRAKHEPLAYILGHKEFFGLDFEVDKNVLIPRPETEILVEQVINKSGKLKAVFVDVGTGSGNIIISLAKNLKQKNDFYGIDISEKALHIAQKNSRKNKVDKKIKFFQSNLLDIVLKNKKILSENLFIVANLPYVSQKIFSNIPDSVKKFEPRKALLSSDNGLGHYKNLLGQIKKIKAANNNLPIAFFFEISPEQKTKMHKLAREFFPKIDIRFCKDLAGKWRVAEAQI